MPGTVPGPSAGAGLGGDRPSETEDRALRKECSESHLSPKIDLNTIAEFTPVIHGEVVQGWAPVTTQISRRHQRESGMRLYLSGLSGNLQSCISVFSPRRAQGGVSRAQSIASQEVSVYPPGMALWGSFLLKRTLPGIPLS